MTSLRGRLFYTSMKLFFSRVVPADLSIEDYRRAARQPLFAPLPRGIRRESGMVGGVFGEWITLPGAAAARVLLYLHGGGYVLRTPRVHRGLVARLAQATGIRAFMADYRLAPEHPFPAAVDDAAAVYRGLLDAGFAPGQIVVAGDSAGGGLTAALLVKLRDAGHPLPAAACLISALLDCAFSDPALAALQTHDPFLRLKDVRLMAACYAGDQDPAHPLISPLYADLRGLPPLLIHAGEHEVLREDSRRFAEKAQAAGVQAALRVWPGMIHAFPLFAALVPEGKAAIAEIAAFFRQHLG